MPGNILFQDALFPQVREEDGWKQTVQKILNYQYLLKEQLSYLLYNLDEENFNAAGWERIAAPIYDSLSATADQLQGEISVQAGSILAQVKANYAELTALTALESEVSRQRSQLNLVNELMDSQGESLSGLELLNYDNSAALTALTQRVNSQAESIAGLELLSNGNSSTLSALSETVSAYNDVLSELRLETKETKSGFLALGEIVTANTDFIYQLQMESSLFSSDLEMLTKAVTSQGDNITRLNMTSDDVGSRLEMVVSSDGFIKTAEIVAAINKSESLVRISAEHLDLNGYVEFSSLSGVGTSSINGSNIDGGSINANTINGQYLLSAAARNKDYGDNQFRGWYGSSVALYGGAVYFADISNSANPAFSPYASLIGDRDEGSVTLAADYFYLDGILKQIKNSSFGDLANKVSTYFYGNVYIDNSPVTASDRRLKRNIRHGLDKYEQLFLSLRPASYQLQSAGNDYYLGFVAQEVEAALSQAGLTENEFAGLVKLPPEQNLETGYEYALRYQDFIPLNTYMIQKLWQRMDSLETMLAMEKGENYGEG